MPKVQPRIDCHAHVYTRDCRLAEGRSYTPAGEAPLGDYLALLDRHGVEQAVLVQPSFLGTDNGFMLDCLEALPERFRAVAVVSPEATDAELERMSALGVKGHRYNLYNKQVGSPAEPRYRALTRRLVEHGWHIQTFVEGARLAATLDVLLEDGARVVVDHFGKPAAGLGVGDPSFRHLLAKARDHDVWVKLSAPYRLDGADPRPLAEALLKHVGPDRLVWGSDWPWVQFENRHGYRDCLDWAVGWCDGDDGLIKRITAASRKLYGFDDPAVG